MNRRIAVTGATSMIGAALIEAAVKDGAEVYAFIRADTGRMDRLKKSPSVHLVTCPLDQLCRLEAPPRGVDAFYHLAWAGTGKARRDDPVIQEQNIRYTLDAVSLAARMGCGRFVGAGSQAEYGPVEGVIAPDTPVNPRIAYGMAKLSAGLLSRKLCAQLGIGHVWARIFSVYGLNDNEGTMINYALERFEAGESAKFSAATQMWNYLYETDAGELLYRLGNDAVADGVYCVAHPESRVLRSYIEQMRAAWGPDARCEYAPQGAAQPGLEVDVSQTIRATGFTPQIAFDDGMQRIISKRKAKAL